MCNAADVHDIDITECCHFPLEYKKSTVLSVLA